MAVREGSEPPPSGPSDAEVARYCAELRALAGRPRLRTVRYLLGMARLGAEREAEAIGWARPR